MTIQTRLGDNDSIRPLHKSETLRPDGVPPHIRRTDDAGDRTNTGWAERTRASIRSARTESRPISHEVTPL
jgi:hypothetical protein